MRDRLWFVALPALLVLAMAGLLVVGVARPLATQLRAQAEARVLDQAQRIAAGAAPAGDVAGGQGLRAWRLPLAPGAAAPPFDAASLAALGDAPAPLRDAEGDEHIAARRPLGPGAQVLVAQHLPSALAPALRLQRAALSLGGLVALACGMLGHFALRRRADGGAPAGAPAGDDAAALRRVIDGLPIGIAVLDPGFRTGYVNAAYTRLLGWTNEQARGRRPSELLLDGPAAAELARLQARIREGPTTLAGRFEARSAAGARVPVQAHVAPLTDAAGRFDGAILMLQDQRAEARARRQADELSDRLRLFADAAIDHALVLLDADGRMLTWSRGARAITGIDPGDALGRHVESLFESADRERGLPRTLLERALAEGQADVEGWHARADGSRFWSRTSLYRLPLGGDAARFALIARDMTAAHEAVQRVADSQAELAALTRRLLAQEKDTTRRLAQVLHDELGQTLAAMRLVYDTSRVQDAGGDLPRPLAEWLDRLIADANQQVRHVLVELRPPLLDEKGLVAALGDELRQRHSLHPALQLQLDAPAAAQERRWPADVEYAAFMVAREALNNALRHARARRIELFVDGDERMLKVQVRDDGCGMPERAAVLRPGHLGMVGMRERAQAIGAGLQIDSLPDAGTTVTLQWGTPGGPDEPPVPDR